MFKWEKQKKHIIFHIDFEYAIFLPLEKLNEYQIYFHLN